MEVIFDRVDESGATGTYKGKPFEVIAERDDGRGNTEYGVVEGDFTDEERQEIFNAWEMYVPAPEDEERRQIAEKIIRCIDFCKEELKWGGSIDGVEYGDLEELKIAVKALMME